MSSYNPFEIQHTRRDSVANVGRGGANESKNFGNINNAPLAGTCIFESRLPEFTPKVDKNGSIFKHKRHDRYNHEYKHNHHDYDSDSSQTEKKKLNWGGAAKGAASGAMAGAMIPGIGIPWGAIAGGLIGGIAGLFG